jgi:hypothetical protein
MKKHAYFLTILLLSPYFSAQAWGILPVSVDNGVWMGSNSPSLTLRLKNIDDGSIQALYFPLYPQPYQFNSFLFFGKNYQILSSQFQYRYETINNFCGLEGKTVSGESLSITLNGLVDTTTAKKVNLSCQINFERLSPI